MNNSPQAISHLTALLEHCDGEWEAARWSVIACENGRDFGSWESNPLRYEATSGAYACTPEGDKMVQLVSDQKDCLHGTSSTCQQIIDPSSASQVLHVHANQSLQSKRCDAMMRTGAVTLKGLCRW